MNNYVVSIIRTVVGLVVGALVGWLVSQGLIDADTSESLSASLVASAVIVFQALWYAFARWIEIKWPNIRMFLVNAQPAYGDEPAVPPVAGPSASG